MGAVLKEVPVNRKPAYRRKVERILKNYPILKAAVELQQKEEAAGLGDFPSCTPSYEEQISVGYSEYRSQTEKYGIMRATKQIDLQRIERAVEILDLDERLLIQERYMTIPYPRDKELQERLCLAEATYRRIKARAMEKLAVVLNLI